MGVGQLIRNIVTTDQKAVANGVASLDSNTKVPKNQISLTASDVGAIASTGNEVLSALNAASGTISSGLLPSYVGDFLTFANLAAFPVTGESGKIYLAENTNLSYRWTGSSYVDISSAGVSDAALKLNTARTITTTGDASYSVSFDGSANVSAALTLANSGVSAGTYGGSSIALTLGVNSKGLITSVSQGSVSVNWISISSKPSSLTGYGITDAFPLSGGTVTGATNFSSNTASTSPTTGALRISAGGLGVFGSIYSGGIISASTSFNIGNTQVVGARRTGWAAATGIATRTTFATSTVTLPELAERLKALVDDLTTHGLIGA